MTARRTSTSPPPSAGRVRKRNMTIGFALAMLTVPGIVMIWVWLKSARPRASTLGEGSANATSGPADERTPSPPANPDPAARASAVPTPAPAASERATAFDSTLSDPIAAEQGGNFRKAYAAWEEDPEDRSATADAERFFDAAFAKFDIHPEAEFVRCGGSLCRARFTFAELKELYKMTQIREADGVKIATTFPETQEGSQTVSIYWTRKANPEGPLTETAGQ